MDTLLAVTIVILVVYVWGLRGRLRKSQLKWTEIEMRWAELTRRVHALEQQAFKTPQLTARPNVETRLEQLDRQLKGVSVGEAPPIPAKAPLPAPPIATQPAKEPTTPPKAPPEAAKPTVIPASPVIPPPLPVLAGLTPPPPAVKPPPATPHPPLPPRAAGAAVHAAAPVEPAPKPAVPPGPAVSFEETLATNYLVKLAVVLAVVAVGLGLYYAFRAFGPAGKDVIAYLMAGAMLGLGIRFEENANWRNFARTGIGGGWALLYVTTYALHHMDAARVIDSEAIDLFLMLLVAAAMVAHTLKYRSQLVTGFAFLLPFFTVGMTMVLAPLAAAEVRSANLYASVILAVGLVVLVNRMRWYELEVFGILAAYVMHLFWLVPIEMRVGQHHDFPELTSSTVLLFAYWLIFRASYLVRRVDEKREESLSSLAALLNTFLFQGINWYQGAHPELAWKFFLSVGIAEMAFGILPMARRRRPAFLILSTIGATLLALSAASYPAISANSLSLTWLLEAEALFLAGVFTAEIQFRRLGMFAAILVAGKLFFWNAVRLQDLRVGMGSAVTDPRLALVFGVAALAFYADVNFIPRKLPEIGKTKFEANCCEYMSHVAALMALLAIWAGFAEQWVAVGWAAMALVAAFAGRRWSFDNLRIQAHVAAAAAFLRAVFVNLAAGPTGHYDALRLLTVALVAALLYTASRWASKHTGERKRGLATLYTWAGTALIWGLAISQLDPKYLALAWLATALALALVGGWAKLRELSYQAQCLAGTAFIAAVVFNLVLFTQSGLRVPGHVHNHERLVLVLAAAGLLYVCARWAGISAVEQAEAIAAGHTWAGSALVALLAAYELDWGWVGLAWSLNALTLYWLAGRLKNSSLYYQAHLLVLAALPLLLFASPQHSRLGLWDSTLLLKLGLPAVATYLSADQCERFERARAKPSWLPYAQTWEGSALVAVLVWYELPAISVAVGWAILGLVVFELGFARSSASLRFQGYAALTAAFVRLWFANLNAPGWERIYSTLPLALAFYYVHERVHSGAEDFLKNDFRSRAARLQGLFGTVTLAALIYFALPDLVGAEWVIAGWAALALALIVVSAMAGKSIYLSHAVGMGLAVVYWAIVYNFAQASHYELSLRSVLASRVGGAAGLMLLALPAAFRHRRAALAASEEKRGSVGRAFAALQRHPHQFFFFAPVTLITILLWRIFPGMLTVAWGLEAVAVFVFGLWVGERSFRLTGMVLLLTCVGRILLDIRKLTLPAIIVTLAVMAVATFVVSWLWTHYREALRRYL